MVSLGVALLQSHAILTSVWGGGELQLERPPLFHFSEMPQIETTEMPQIETKLPQIRTEAPQIDNKLPQIGTETSQIEAELMQIETHFNWK